MPIDEVVIDESGRNGANGEPGISGPNGEGHGDNGGNGANGKRGIDGKPGENIFMHLSTLQNQVVLDANFKTYYLTLGNPYAHVLTLLNGGSGGNGGPGGHGGDGSRGYHGSDATQFSWGSDGGPGGNGGNGGDGGYGGNGAPSGDLYISLSQADTDLLMLLDTPNLSGGMKGLGGAGGFFGIGGAGGTGGHSYTWYEDVHHWNTDLENNTYFTTETISHTNPGGSDGRPGSNGRTGDTGRNGIDGKNGSLTINVDGQIYNGFYDLALQGFNIISPDDILEPGEIVKIANTEFRNSGMMPTPHRPINIGLRSNQWINFDKENSVQINQSLLPSNSSFVSDIAFTINKPEKIPTNKTFKQKATLQFDAMMTRVNKYFKNLPTQTHEIDIRYPVEISTSYIPATITKDEEAPFVIKIRNVSSKEIGFASTDPRILEISLDNKKELVDFYQNGVFVDAANKKIGSLKPAEEAYFTGTMKFRNDVSAYKNAILTFKLHLGEVNHKDTKSEIIQKRTAKLQLAENYSYDPNADFVLVTNNQTTNEMIQEWKNKISKLGGRASIWNASLYEGLSYTQKRNDQGSFIEQMQGKVMVLLNNEMRLGNETKRATDCLDTMEMLTAAKLTNVSTYVVGNNFDIAKSITPLKSLISNDQTYPVQERFLFWRKPKSQHLIKEAMHKHDQLYKDDPNHRYLTICDFVPSKQTTGFSLRPKWSLGQIEVRETVNQANAHIAVGGGHADIDTYNIIKLLPFAKKLVYLNQQTDARMLEIVKKAILSDLTQELLTYTKANWKSGFNKHKLSAALVNLKMFANFNALNQTDLREIIVKYDYFADRIPTTWDKILFPCFRRRCGLRNAVHDAFKEVGNNYFPDMHIWPEWKLLNERYKKVSRENLFLEFGSPYRNNTTFDNEVQIPSAVLRDSLPVHVPVKSSFKEGIHFFADDKKRNLKIEEYKPNCRFD